MRQRLRSWNLSNSSKILQNSKSLGPKYRKVPCSLGHQEQERPFLQRPLRERHLSLSSVYLAQILSKCLSVSALRECGISSRRPAKMLRALYSSMKLMPSRGLEGKEDSLDRTTNEKIR